MLSIINPALFWLALNTYHEARGESFLSQVDVANVVLNRVESKHYPDNIYDVVTQGGERRNRCQFSWFCDGRSDEAGDGEAWRIAVKAASLAMNGYDETHGALFYYNPDKVEPYWAKHKTFVKMSGHHVLLK